MSFRIGVLDVRHPARVVFRGGWVEKVELEGICGSVGEHLVSRDLSLKIERARSSAS
jgi:hypothetical protein